MIRLLRPILIVCAVTALVSAAACNTDRDDVAANAAPPRVQVGPENIAKVASERIVVGPTISGELAPAQQSTVRAELGGSMTQVSVEAGDRVRRGQVLGRIESTTLADARQSAASAVRSTEAQLEVARNEANRARELVAAGAIAQRDLEAAQSNVSVAEAQLADARSRLAIAEKQLSDAVIRSPIAGIVSDRPVSRGDVVSIGTTLFTIVDPSSMRLVASVSAADIGALRPGARVEFQVRGYDRTFAGAIDRVAPQADPVTRQVPIYVSIPNTERQLVGGLFAEGRIISHAADGLVVPAEVVDMSGGMPWVLRVRDNVAERVPVTVGLSDPDTGRLQITSGVAAGDILLRGPARQIDPGTPVELAATA